MHNIHKQKQNQNHLPKKHQKTTKKSPMNRASRPRRKPQIKSLVISQASITEKHTNENLNCAHPLTYIRTPTQKQKLLMQCK
jgi:hypothetical protein